MISAARPGELARWSGVGAAVLATAIGVRLLWTVAAALWAQWRIQRGWLTAPSDGPLPSWRTGLIIGWAGTRGLPHGGHGAGVAAGLSRTQHAVVCRIHGDSRYAADSGAYASATRART